MKFCKQNFCNNCNYYAKFRLIDFITIKDKQSKSLRVESE